MGGKRETKKHLSPDYCEICGYDIYITRHRIRPGRKGGKYKLGNVISVCPNCHAECEKGLISPLVLFSIIYARIREEMKNK